MVEADRGLFTVGLRALATVLRFDLTEAIIEGYWQGLEGLELAAIGQAMRRAWRECRWMPPPAELRAFAKHAAATAFPSREEARADQRRIEAEKARVRETWPRQLGPVGATSEKT